MLCSTALSSKTPGKYHNLPPWSIEIIRHQVFSVTIDKKSHEPSVEPLKRQYLTNTSGNIVIRSLRERTFQKIMSNDISYFDGNQSGEIVSRLSSDCQIIGNSATVNLNEGTELCESQFSQWNTFSIKIEADLQTKKFRNSGEMTIFAWVLTSCFFRLNFKRNP